VETDLAQKKNLPWKLTLLKKKICQLFLVVIAQRHSALEVCKEKRKKTMYDHVLM
jgi:hypothetical protein